MTISEMMRLVESTHSIALMIFWLNIAGWFAVIALIAAVLYCAKPRAPFLTQRKRKLWGGA